MKRPLNDEENAEAQRLADAWLAYKKENKGATQVWLADAAGLGTQGAVGQYLRGVIPLNLNALIALSRVLGVRPADISPRLTANVGELILNKHGDARASDSSVEVRLTYETGLEMVMLSVHHLASPADRAAIDALVDQVRRRLPAADRAAIDAIVAQVCRRVPIDGASHKE